MISVIIPVYNRSRFILEAIDSVKRQTYRDIEIIVVDDGSTDRTEHVVKRLGNQVKYIYQKNQGPSVARNNGIRAAKGKWIAFLDSDDIFLPDKLAEQIKLFKDNNIGLVHSYYYRVHILKNSIQVIEPNFSKDRKNLQQELLKRKHTIRTSTVLVRKSCFEQVGCFNPKYPAAEDWDMWIRLASKFDFACVKKPLAIYRRHPNSLVERNEGPAFHKEIVKNASIIYQSQEGLKK